MNLKKYGLILLISLFSISSGFNIIMFVRSQLEKHDARVEKETVAKMIQAIFSQISNQGYITVSSQDEKGKPKALVLGPVQQKEQSK